jgi:hypothetical protein
LKKDANETIQRETEEFKEQRQAKIDDIEAQGDALEA